MASASAIGPYRILEPLGHGGMGVVYRARHSGSERAVALKTVKITAPKWLDSIRREIDALTRIRHPGIVRIVEHGVHEGRPWYAMDLLEGESLRHFGDRIWSPYRSFSARAGSTDTVGGTASASGDFSTAPGFDPEPSSGTARRPTGVRPAAGGELQKVLQLARRVCATLAFLHGEGFVNCDLKPENVLLVADQPVIIDFGLAAHHPGGSGREALEVQRAMTGTLPYMSPEQIRGEFVDARSDIYSVGCMLYELVTGRPPFLGAPRAIMTQHLSNPPMPPSELVEGLPDELERLILKLLEKRLTDRFGFADEVAAVLADMSGDVHRLPNFPPARPYLYRPRFVGRDDVVRRLAEMRERAAAGSGSLTLLAGESGVGKTRVAMELTRVSPSSRMRVVTSESSPLSAAESATAGAAPLDAIRPLLRAAADRCQEGGPAVTEKLLGPRRAVLAPYEPLLAQVPATEALASPEPLPLEASRQRLFHCIAETLAALSRELPVLWVLDDLGWADELSHDFLRSLTREYLESTPVFIVGTYRSEEETDAIAALARLPFVAHVTLPRLDQDAVAAMISDMLALEGPKDAFAEFVARQAEGNPFFVAEHVRTAVTERVLFRDQTHAWQLAKQTSQAAVNYESLPLPRSLRELLDHRLRKLTHPAQQLALAAAVLGREADVEALREVAALPNGVAEVALDELLRRQILEQPEPGRVRFLHDKLREVGYRQGAAERRIELHARAGLFLEVAWRDTSDDGSKWATLGHHFAAGKSPEAAARYLALAARHARSTYANGDAIRLYREAIRQIHQIILQLSGDPASWQDTLTELYEAHGDVLALVGRRDEARAMYQEALTLTLDLEKVKRARLHRKTGKTWETQHQHDDALRCYGVATDVLEPDPTSRSPEQRDEWIQIRVDQLWVHYFLDRISDMNALVNVLEPVIQEHAPPLQRAKFLRVLWMRNIRQDRYVATEATLSLARSAFAASQQAGDPDQLLADHFGLGFVSLFSGRLGDAARELQGALILAERGGDLARQARCLTYLSVSARIAGDVSEVRDFTRRSDRVAFEAGMRDCLAAARANAAWISLRDGDHDSSVSLAREALRIWESLPLVYPLQWLALLPLLHVSLRRDDLDEALSCSTRLLLPNQQRLPEPAVDAFTSAGELFAGGDRPAARAAMSAALSCLSGAGYE